jgi:uncharacterized membrane protein
MNQAHLHLVITHLPIFGSILAALVLIFGLWSKSGQTKMAAYLVFVISAIGAVIAYLTGDGAEHTVKTIQGISKDLIHEHEESAMFALISMIILGIISLYGLFVTYKNKRYEKSVSLIILFFSLLSFSIVARTGWLGGQIRHTEISNAPVQNSSGPVNSGKDDD